MTSTYKRATFVGPRQLRFDELPLPEPGPRQVLLRVKACALCTWEQRSYTGEEGFYPISSGHEVSGEVVAVGSDAFTDATVGDRAVGSMLFRCGCCEPCRRGMDNLCDNNRKAYWGRDVVGPAGLSEYVLIDDYQVYKADGGASYEEICLSEPLACVVRSIAKARLEQADYVVVIGAGIMGILHVLLAKQAGATVFVSEMDQKRADFALSMGADAIINPEDSDFADSVKHLTNGRGADVVFCAVSVASVLEGALEAAAKGGRVHVYASIHPRGTLISVDPNLFHSKEITLTGTMSQDKEDMRQAVQMISRRVVDIRPLISATFPLSQLEDALQAALTKDTYRVIITP